MSNSMRFFDCPSIDDTKSHGNYSRGRLKK
nr:MAG TPA: hypothetical protein [Caudoviricetes sp.]